MPLRIAIPEPSSLDTEYNQRALPPYLAALHSAGAVPLLVPLHERPDRVARLLAQAHGILLPGSRYDVEPERFNEARIPQCGPADSGRTAADELLLQDAFNLRKPILAICHGAQTLNVWRNGSLFQDLPTQLGTQVDHSPGRAVVEAHPVRLTPGSRLAALSSAADESRKNESQSNQTQTSETQTRETQVNSSHHQAIRRVGDQLRVAAVSPADGVIEAVELDSADHWVVAVQWHPERTYAESPLSRDLFAAFLRAAQAWQPRPIHESVHEPIVR
ncbi:MAG TPA: gamma-glutamyl-gamma-aminobutyrate hydrolase family protein [Terracidiphilus sp.]|nr:gamma-glutamyl-gamma-aminobutyrate hydrolase family protein [Terracidiphilus sp.]